MSRENLGLTVGPPIVEKRQHGRGSAPVQPEGRLVEQQDGRRPKREGRQTESAFFALTQPKWNFIGEMAETEMGEHQVRG